MWPQVALAHGSRRMAKRGKAFPPNRTQEAREELGAFPMVAEATDSSTFRGSISLSDLWASLPDLPGHVAVIGDARRWLALRPQQPVLTSTGWVSPRLTAGLVPKHGVFTTVDDDDLDGVLADYPKAAGWTRGSPQTQILSFPTRTASCDPSMTSVIPLFLANLFGPTVATRYDRGSGREPPIRRPSS